MKDRTVKGLLAATQGKAIEVRKDFSSCNSLAPLSFAEVFRLQQCRECGGDYFVRRSGRVSPLCPHCRHKHDRERILKRGWLTQQRRSK